MTTKSEPFEIFMHKTIAKTLFDKGIITLERYTAILSKLDSDTICDQRRVKNG